MWSLQNITPGGFFANEATTKLHFEWDLDQGVTLEAEANVEEHTYHADISILGFHPYKEIVFLWTNSRRVVAYHLTSSRVQDLGELPVQFVQTSFVYTALLDGWMIRKQST
jgi:hypothetical protein